MLRSENNVRLIGNIGADPVLRYTPDGMAITTFSLATHRFSRNKLDEAGKPVQKTQWHRVVCFAQQAEYIGANAKKGNQVIAEGEYSSRPFEQTKTMTVMLKGKPVEADVTLKREYFEMTANNVSLLNNVQRATDDWGDEPSAQAAD